MKVLRKSEVNDRNVGIRRCADVYSRMERSPMNIRSSNDLRKSLDWMAIASFEELSPIIWKFIPTTADFSGRRWEPLIRCGKIPLIRTLGSSTLTFEELMTVLCEVVESVNKRPRTYISKIEQLSHTAQF